MKSKNSKKNIINRKVCICKGKLKENIDFGDLPLINNYNKKKNLVKYPTVISQCKKCLLIQLKYTVSDDFLFPKNYSYSSGNSKEKLNNFTSLANKIKKKSKKIGKKILDIGSNDGSFLKIAKKKGFRVLGVEPTNTANLPKNKGIVVDSWEGKELKSRFELAIDIALSS